MDPQHWVNNDIIVRILKPPNSRIYGQVKKKHDVLNNFADCRFDSLPESVEIIRLRTENCVTRLCRHGKNIQVKKL